MSQTTSGARRTGPDSEGPGADSFDGDDFDGFDGEDGDDDGEPDDEDGAPDDDDPRPSGRTAVRVIRLVLGAVLFVVAVLVVSSITNSGPATPSDNSVAAGLARDMTDHHAQAVDMATIIQARTTDPAIRTLATDIALGQTNQMGQMQGWLNEWNLSIGRSGKPMAWMGDMSKGMQMNGSTANVDPSMMELRPDGLMPGMATQAEVNQLRTLPPKQADVLFLKLMINHHRGGVAMAQAAIDLTKVRVVVNLCRTMVASQSNEINQMTQMLQQRT